MIAAVASLVMLGTIDRPPTAAQTVPPLTQKTNPNRVGINNSNPASTLDIGGNVNATGSVNAGSFRGDGSQLSNLPPAGGASLVRGVIGRNASSTSYALSSADFVQLYNPAARGVDKVALNIGPLTCSATAQGRNGRDQANAFTNHSWIYLYYTWDGATVATRFSANAPATGPILASGETSWAFVGAFRWAAGVFVANTYIRGSLVAYHGEQRVLNAGSRTTYTSVDLSAYVPPPSVAPVWDGSVAITAASTYDTLQLSYNATNRIVMLTIPGGTYVFPSQLSSPLASLANISQTIYYSVTGSAAAGDINVVGYRVVNGG